eukprot:scaffold37401_cov25-Tisochrysis_lutea.AAC.4
MTPAAPAASALAFCWCIVSAEANWPFLMCSTQPVAAAARIRSVCLQRGAQLFTTPTRCILACGS